MDSKFKKKLHKEANKDGLFHIGLDHPDGTQEDIAAVAIIAFERNDKGIRLRILDNPEISEDWWRAVIKGMYDGLDSAMAARKLAQEKEKHDDIKAG